MLSSRDGWGDLKKLEKIAETALRFGRAPKIHNMSSMSSKKTGPLGPRQPHNDRPLERSSDFSI